MKLFKRNNQSYDQWCESPQGKKFLDKIQLAAEESARKKAEWEANVQPDKKEQVKLFKIIITPLFIIFAAADYFSLKYFKFPIVFSVEIIIGLIGFILFKKNPIKIKYPNCFMMAPIALFFSLLFSVYLCVSIFGFKQALMIKQPITVLSEPVNEVMSELDFLNRDYSQWLKENNFETSEELTSDYKKYRYENE